MHYTWRYTAIKLHYYRIQRRFLNFWNPMPANVSPAAGRVPSPLPDAALPARRPAALSVLAWPAWLRVLAVLPAVALLWLGVAWAQMEAAPW